MKINELNFAKLKKDRYSKARGGNSNFLDIYCSKCNQYLLLYQKDGPGSLLRLYLDRIFNPEKLALLSKQCSQKKDMPNLNCENCHSLIAVPMVYISERRLAFKLIYGKFVKKNSTGEYPPTELILKK